MDLRKSRKNIGCLQQKFIVEMKRCFHNQSNINPNQPNSRLLNAFWLVVIIIRWYNCFLRTKNHFKTRTFGCEAILQRINFRLSTRRKPQVNLHGLSRLSTKQQAKFIAKNLGSDYIALVKSTGIEPVLKAKKVRRAIGWFLFGLD